MLKLVAFFAFLAISFASNGWVGTWNVTNFFSNWYCGGSYPTGTITITAANSTALQIKGPSSQGDTETWELPWAQFNSTGTDCQSGGDPVCTQGDLESHGSDIHGQIKWYCSYKPQVLLYEGISIQLASTGSETSNTEENNFLSF